MAIQCTTPMSAIENRLNRELQKIIRGAIRQLAYAGAECVKTARAKHFNDWTDQTGNLRSSIGFVVVYDGEIVQMSNFEIVKDGKQGHDDGISYVTRLAAGQTSGIALIVVAGMNYAYHVAKTRDVLDGAELKAEQIVPQLLKQLNI